MKALVAGWFSFDGMGATAGDLLARDVACDWLRRADVPFDVAHSSNFDGGVEWSMADTGAYSHLVFVCGPLGNGEPVTDLFARFDHCRLVGLNLSMLQSIEEWDPFDLLLERDSSREARADLTFVSANPHVPVVGKVLVHPQREYANPLHRQANEALDRLLSSREVATVQIDTCFDPPNATGLRTPGEVESVIARMDVVVTTRLHGMVLALKNGVPVLALDPIAGGAKIRRQAQTIDWPVCFTADDVSDDRLGAALDHCLGEEARAAAVACATRAAAAVRRTGDEFMAYLEHDRTSMEG